MEITFIPCLKLGGYLIQPDGYTAITAVLLLLLRAENLIVVILIVTHQSLRMVQLMHTVKNRLSSSIDNEASH